MITKPVDIGKPSLVNKRKSFSGSKIFFYIFSVLLFLSVIYYFSEIEREIVLLEKVKLYWLLSAIVVQCATYLVNAFIYQLLMKGYNIQPLPGLPELFRISLISLFFNQTVPSANISGNTFIFNYLLKRKINGGRIVSVILLELVLFYAAMAGYCIFFMLATRFFYPMPSAIMGVLTAGFVIFLFFVVIILLLIKKRSLKYIVKRLAKIKFIKKYIRPLEQQLTHPDTALNKIELLPFIYSHKRLVVVIVAGQIFAIALDAITIVLLSYGIGSSIPLFIALLILVGTRAVSILPVSPGSLILFESSMVFLLNSMGVPLGISIMVTLLFRLLSFWLPIPAGFILYRRWVHAKA